jgi:DNA-binding NarL/FixJ family response regulator
MRDDATDAGEPQVIRVVVADDHPIVRAGLLAVLAPIADIEVVGTASTAAEAVAAAPGADLVLMDLSFGDGPTGIDATREIASLPIRIHGVGSGKGST